MCLVNPAIHGYFTPSRQIAFWCVPLADYVFEPAMQPGGKLTSVFGGIFGTGLGAGMALQLSLFAMFGIVVAVGGYGVKQLVTVEDAPSTSIAN